jgi:hypothetical protein
MQQILSRLRGKKKEKDQTTPGSAGKDKRKLPELNEFLHNRDYAGAISVLTVCYLCKCGKYGEL